MFILKTEYLFILTSGITFLTFYYLGVIPRHTLRYREEVSDKNSVDRKTTNVIGNKYLRTVKLFY